METAASFESRESNFIKSKSKRKENRRGRGVSDFSI